MNADDVPLTTSKSNTRRLRRRLLSSIAVAALAVPWSSCGSGEETNVAEDAGTSGVYVVLELADWELRRAIRFRAGAGKLGEHEPGLDWFAEYDGPQEHHADGSWTVRRVRMSGHRVTLSTLREVAVGAEFAPGELHGRRMLVAPPDEGDPHLMLIEMRPQYAVMVVSHDADVRPLADRLVVVDEAAWVQGGGKMIDCVPLTSGCSLA